MTKTFFGIHKLLKLLSRLLVVEMVVLLLICQPVFAQVLAHQSGDASLHNGLANQTSQQQVNQRVNQQFNKNINVERQAEKWGLTKEDYQQYQKEMANTPSGHWWKNLDPSQVLGMNAKTEEERMKFAKIDVQLDYQRASKEIDFQHAYSQAFAELYPNAKPININTSKSAKLNTVQSNDKFYLFTPMSDSEGAMLVEKMITLMHGKSDISLNVFFVGQYSLKGIQQWANSNNIPKRMKSGNRITLNHNAIGGNDLLHNVLKGRKVTFPALIRVRNGRSSVVMLTDL